MVNTKLYQQETHQLFKNFNLHEATKLFNAVLYEKNPDIEILEKLANYNEYKLGTTKQLVALHIKLKLSKYKPSELESSMTARQLYELNNDLWLNAYSIDEIATGIHVAEIYGKDKVFQFMHELE